MILLPKMIYLFAFDSPADSLGLTGQLVYYNNIQHINDIKDWQKLIDKQRKSLTNE